MLAAAEVFDLCHQGRHAGGQLLVPTRFCAGVAVARQVLRLAPKTCSAKNRARGWMSWSWAIIAAGGWSANHGRWAWFACPGRRPFSFPTPPPNKTFIEPALRGRIRASTPGRRSTSAPDGAHEESWSNAQRPLRVRSSVRKIYLASVIYLVHSRQRHRKASRFAHNRSREHHHHGSRV